MWLLEVVAIIGSLSGALALGGRGSKRNALANFGAALLVGTSVWMLFLNMKLAIALIVFNVIVMYLLTFILNRRYKGFDDIESNARASETIEELLKRTKKNS